jgi:hypothetical protein
VIYFNISGTAAIVINNAQLAKKPYDIFESRTDMNNERLNLVHMHISLQSLEAKPPKID